MSELSEDTFGTPIEVFGGKGGDAGSRDVCKEVGQDFTRGVEAVVADKEVAVARLVFPFVGGVIYGEFVGVRHLFKLNVSTIMFVKSLLRLLHFFRTCNIFCS